MQVYPTSRKEKTPTVTQDNYFTTRKRLSTATKLGMLYVQAISIKSYEQLLATFIPIWLQQHLDD